ncbi:hypothetical protein DV736_g1006, partial [Chaetothyriales sp. CBS 134916]
MDMLSRLKGAIDTRIAEEQARQRQAAVSAASHRNQQRARRAPTQNGQGGLNASKFEPEFAVGDDDSTHVPSRTATPRPETQDPAVSQTTDGSHGQGEKDSGNEATATQTLPASQTTTQPSERSELPDNVRARLQKLDRLETKYGELLKVYRMAHARVKVIEPFEAVLREHTPLTNISDPSALVEYLCQATAKNNMVLDEFKRVSAERDELKARAQQAEDDASQLRAQVVDLQKAAAAARPHSLTPEQAAADSEVSATVLGVSTEATEVSSPPASVMSPASTSSHIPSFTLFSQRARAAEPSSSEPAEDLFSFDSEVPKLEAELQHRQSEVEELKSQMQKLKGDLVVAREATEGMVLSLESATRELHELRDGKDRFDEVKASLETRVKELQQQVECGTKAGDDAAVQIEHLLAENGRLSAVVDNINKDIEAVERSRIEAEEKLKSSQTQATILNEKLSQKDATVKDLEDSLAMALAAQREAEQQGMAQESSEKKLATMQAIMDTLRTQLQSAEKTITDLREEIKTAQSSADARPSAKILAFLDQPAHPELKKLETKEDVVDYLATNFGLRRNSPTETHASLATSTPSEVAPSHPSKRSKKKKKKAKGGQSTIEKKESEPEDSAKADENVADTRDVGQDHHDDTISKLETEIEQLRSEVEEKDAAVARLTKQAKDQVDLKEEIETLRDDLLHQGEEHVQARDALKMAETARKRLADQVDALEAEVAAAKQKLAKNKVSSEAHQKTVQELEESKGNLSSLQKDLNVAEQLAAARFKDLTDLKELLAKVQPELRNLRNEADELKTAKEDLKNKAGELHRLEARHDDLKAEMKGLSRRLGDKDTEIKELQQKIEQETSTRTRAEEDLRTVQSGLRSTEARRQELFTTYQEYQRDLRKAKDETLQLRTQLGSLEAQLSGHDRQVQELREEISLKVALHASAQNLVQSLREQTHELTAQAREAGARAENLEEELTESQRMLSERTRESQTMQVLLNQAETGTESRIREMKERMDVAIEERDRIEDEASVSNRRMMRELDEAKAKARDAQRALKIAEDDKEELELKQAEWKRQRGDLERASQRATKEAEDLRAAMSGLRQALNESERQLREMELQKADLRRMGDEAKDRVDELSRANQTLAEEVKLLQASVKKKVATAMAPSASDSSDLHSPARTSSSADSSRRPTPTPRLNERTLSARSATPTGLSQGTVDFVYLKNVLLQFLEQKDKMHQRQLIPVLGMLLHFDRKDEQKWMSAITAK